MLWRSSNRKTLKGEVIMSILKKHLLPALIEWLYMTPILLPLSILIIDESSLPVWGIHMMLSILAGLLMTTFFPLQKRWQSIFFSLCIGAISLLLWTGDWKQTIFTMTITSILAYRGMLYGMYTELLHHIIGSISLVLFFFSSLFFSFHETLQPHAITFAWISVFILAIVLAHTNIAHLKAAALTQDVEDKKAVRPLMYANRPYLLMLFLIIMGITLYDTVWKWVLDTIGRWFANLSFTPPGRTRNCPHRNRRATTASPTDGKP